MPLQDNALPDSARMICDKINKGMAFEEAVKQYSADKKRAQGRIGTFEEDDLFALPSRFLSNMFKTGGITNPIRFSYGYEIMKVTRSEAAGLVCCCRKTRSSINIIRSRYSYDYKNFVDQIRKNFIVKPDSAVAAKFVSSFDTTKTPLAHWAEYAVGRIPGKDAFQVRCLDAECPGCC